MYKILKPSLLIVFPLVLATGCSEDDNNHAHSDAAPPMDAPVDVTISFAAKVGLENFTCASGDAPATFSGLGTSAEQVSFKDFRLYLSNIRMLDAEGHETPVTLTNDNTFQLQKESDHVALLDFEDGTGLCGDLGNPDLNSRIVGTVPPGTYSGVVFELGVPFALNHLDVATAEAPLNVGAMYWAWAAGHKFARIDYVVATDPPSTWNAHLGSTMCTSKDKDTPPSAGCARPNRATVRLEHFNPATQTIVFDAAALVANSDLSKNLGAQTPGCMSFPHDELDCTDLFSKLGMAYTTGACATNCSGQSVFTVE